jgi:hypothetical protein
LNKLQVDRACVQMCKTNAHVRLFFPYGNGQPEFVPVKSQGFIGVGHDNGYMVKVVERSLQESGVRDDSASMSNR